MKYHCFFEQVEPNSERWLDLTPLKQEAWKNIPNYEDLYQVSNYGRVKSLKYDDGVRKHMKTKILKQCLNTNGYYIVNLNNKSHRVHRLIAKTFISNPNNYPCVNHIDGNKENNRVNNLEWCTSSYNNKEAYRLGLKRPPMQGKKGEKFPKKMKKILMCDEKGKIIEKFWCLADIPRKYGYSRNEVSKCCRGLKDKYLGYIWRYADE